MKLDLRLPIGIIFTIYGVLLGGYGLITNGDKAMYERSLNLNVNLGWGLVMLVFGVGMLLMALRGGKSGGK
ncbi:MAG: hypothetical protein U1F65_02375 [Verrucomicrobiota bacterium]